MRLDQAPADRQPQAISPLASGSGGIHAIEPLENPRLMLDGNAVARIRHAQHRLIVINDERHADFTPARGMTNRVGNQIRSNPRQKDRVTSHRDRSLQNFRGESNACAVSKRSVLMHNIIHDFA